VVDAIDHVILCRKWPWQSLARWGRGFFVGRSLWHGERLGSKPGGRSFHIDRRTRGGAIFATRPSKEKRMRVREV
jgi:hypothetical protein